MAPKPKGGDSKCHQRKVVLPPPLFLSDVRNETMNLTCRANVLIAELLTLAPEESFDPRMSTLEDSKCSN